MCPFCSHVGSALARELGPGRGGLVKNGRDRAEPGDDGPPRSLDQWSTPLGQNRSRAQVAPPMPSRSVKTAASAPSWLPCRLRRERPARRLVHFRGGGKGVSVAAAVAPGSDRIGQVCRVLPAAARYPERRGAQHVPAEVRRGRWARRQLGPHRFAKRAASMALSRAGQGDTRAATAGPGRRGGGIPRCSPRCAHTAPVRSSTVAVSAAAASVHPAGSENSCPFSSCRWTRSSPQFWR